MAQDHYQDNPDDTNADGKQAELRQTQSKRQPLGKQQN
jgi:hypothetical protein